MDLTLNKTSPIMSVSYENIAAQRFILLSSAHGTSDLYDRGSQIWNKNEEIVTFEDCDNFIFLS